MTILQQNIFDTELSQVLEIFSEAEREEFLKEIFGNLTSDQREFASIFRYRFDCIQGKGCPETGTGVKWFSPKRPLDDEDLFVNWRNPEEFVGVSFNKQTSYALLDVDAGSDYHPIPQLDRIEEALKSVGINKINWYHSSGSNGWHGYIPFDHTIPTWGVACVLAQALTESGFKIAKGQLEIFPNLKTWDSKYNSHRLPLQAGFEFAKEEIGYFLMDWKEAAVANNAESFFSKIEEAKAWVKNQKISKIKEEAETNNASKNFIPLKKGKDSINPNVKSRAAIWYENLQETIKTGWTADGQTNDILGDVAAYHRVFNPEVGSVEKLAKLVEQTAISLPGYNKYCDHTHHISKRAGDWAKSAWKKYRPFGSCTHKTYEKKSPEENKNLLKVEESKLKITTAIENLKSRGEKITQRAVAREAGISVNTVLKHKELLTLTSEAPKEGNQIPILNSERYETTDQVIDHPQKETLTTVQKITRAIEVILKSEEPLTISHISKLSGCSRNTVKAHRNLIPIGL